MRDPGSTSLGITGAGPARGAERPAMEPTRPAGATLAQLLEVLLNKGVYLDLDLIISVADIPLIGVNLRATIAGIETMLEYGMMRQWDADTRAWVQKSLGRGLPLREEEDVVASMAGGYHDPGPPPVWRPGRVYLTGQRIIVHRRDPDEVLWEAELDSLDTACAVEEAPSFGEPRTRLELGVQDGGTARLTAAEPQRFLKLLREQRPGITDAAPAEPREEHAGDTLKGRMWFLEELSGDALWRGGEAEVSFAAGFTWKAALDTRASVRIGPEDELSVSREERPNPSGTDEVLVLSTSESSIRVAPENLARWEERLERGPARAERATSKEANDGAQR